MPAICCGLAPMLFGRKPLKVVQGTKPSQVCTKPTKTQKEMKGARRDTSSQSVCNIILVMELRKKIVTFRDILDLPPCNTTVSTDQLLIGVMKDLHKFYPESLPRFRGSELRGLPLDKVLIHFCKALQDLGNTSKMNDEWIDKCKYDIYENEKCKKVDKLVGIAVATLTGLIKIAKEKFDMMDEDDEGKDYSPKANTFGKVLKDNYSENSSSSCPSPVTPTSVLPELMNGSPKSSSSSLLLSLRFQAVGKLNPIDVRKLPLHILPKVSVPVPSCLNQKKIIAEKQKEEAKGKPVRKAPLANETRDSTLQNTALSKSSSSVVATPPSSPPSSPSVIQPHEFSINMEVAEEIALTPPATPKENLSPTSSSQQGNSSTDMETDVRLAPPPTAAAAPSSEVLSPRTPSQTTERSIDMEIDIKSVPPPPSPPPPPPPPPPPQFIQPNVAPRGPPLPLPPPPISQPNVEGAQPTLIATEPQLQTAATELPSPPPPPPPPARWKLNAAVTASPPEEPLTPTPPSTPGRASEIPPPPPPPSSSGKASGIPPPPPPPSMMLSKGLGPLPPAPPMSVANGASPPPPPPMSVANGSAPPPPPPGPAKLLRPKKASTKLKRSTHMGNLYRILKGKVEGRPVQEKSSNGKNAGAGRTPSTKLGMADALAEMTKRSAYFQQIEEDVSKYSKSIAELKRVISGFSTKDMTELLNFHKHVESFLEKLTDESQVLARFEGFPIKKLEAVRAASALYSKLESMVTDLQNWKVEPPLSQLLDKVERYFDKIKGDLDALERTKDQESKQFKSQNIDFDFQILVRIKEAMVDVSSNCMELALKERRELKLADNERSKAKSEQQKKICSKILWRAFQFAFRVYTFAGGHDERADKLTRELAHEIETDPQHE